MSTHQKLPHVACYDIADPKRLTRVHRYLKRIGVPLQYSVFLLYVDAAERGKVLSALNRLIDRRHDDVRIYPLPRHPEWQGWGQPCWPEGMFLSGVPLPGKVNPTKLPP